MNGAIHQVPYDAKINLPGWRGKKLFMDDVFDAVSGLDPSAIVLFGSAVRDRFEAVEDSFLWFRTTTPRRVFANDIDVLVISSHHGEGHRRHRANARFSVVIGYYEYGGVATEMRNHADLHLLVISAEEFDRKRAEGWDVADAVCSEGVLLAGTFPHAPHRFVRKMFGGYVIRRAKCE